MTRLKLAVGTLVLIGLGTALVVEHQSPANRREQNLALNLPAEPALLPEEDNPCRSDSVSKMAGARPPALAHTAAPQQGPRWPEPRAEAEAGAVQITNLVGRLMKGEEFKLSRAQVEA